MTTFQYLSYTGLFYGGRVFRQAEIAKKMVGKTEIIQKLTAAGNENWVGGGRNQTGVVESRYELCLHFGKF